MSGQAGFTNVTVLGQYPLHYRQKKKKNPNLKHSTKHMTREYLECLFGVILDLKYFTN